MKSKKFSFDKNSSNFARNTSVFLEKNFSANESYDAHIETIDNEFADCVISYSERESITIITSSFRTITIPLRDLVSVTLFAKYSALILPFKSDCRLFEIEVNKTLGELMALNYNLVNSVCNVGYPVLCRDTKGSNRLEVLSYIGSTGFYFNSSVDDEERFCSFLDIEALCFLPITIPQFYCMSNEARSFLLRSSFNLVDLDNKLGKEFFGSKSVKQSCLSIVSHIIEDSCSPLVFHSSNGVGSVGRVVFIDNESVYFDNDSSISFLSIREINDIKLLDKELWSRSISDSDVLERVKDLCSKFKVSYGEIQKAPYLKSGLNYSSKVS